MSIEICQINDHSSIILHYTYVIGRLVKNAIKEVHFIIVCLVNNNKVRIFAGT